MHYISRILIIIAVLVFAQNADAQPPTRRNGKDNTEKREKAAAVTLTERAKSQYPVSDIPQEVDWRRDIYRSLDLEAEENATLYYPVEPMGESINLFTLLFQLILSEDITAYKYNLDGYESFVEDNKMDPKTMLENYRVYYEEKDGELIVGKSDVPSAEVLSYYVKESHYYDQRRGTYGKSITAICPVLHRAGEFSSEVTKYPMFWISYEDIKPYLAQHTVMTGNLNNVARTTFDDFFTRGLYKGDIYKTVNARNLAISQYCKDSTEIKKEQERIEKQLKDFETNLWNSKTVAEIRQDSINAANAAANDTISADKKKKKTINKRTVQNSTKKTEKRPVKTATPKREKVSKPSSSGTVSVRRERR
ncbi:MAG: gliding motility protein GldN [Bacteroidaceae bacterium]|nr:gliding motility protein GldN [Bacteroidaceae bacterium]